MGIRLDPMIAKKGQKELILFALLQTILGSHYKNLGLEIFVK